MKDYEFYEDEDKDLTDEEFDELYRPKKSNSRKSLAPLFIYEILTKNSNTEKHLRHKDILDILSRYPYEVTLERKALGRIIHILTDSWNHAVCQDSTGVWVEHARVRL